jgi:hypothetical protein
VAHLRGAVQGENGKKGNKSREISPYLPCFQLFEVSHYRKWCGIEYRDVLARISPLFIAIACPWLPG